MKTLKNEKGLKLKACLNCKPVLSTFRQNIRVRLCPCPNFSGEKLFQNGKITVFGCENRKMHRPPKIKHRAPKGTPKRRSKRKGIK